MKYSLRRRPTAIAGAILGLLIVGAVTWALWPENVTTSKFESSTEDYGFSFERSSGEQQTLRVALTLSASDTAKLKDARAAVEQGFELLAPYEQSASGEVECRVQVFINDERWLEDVQSFGVQKVPQDEWTHQEEDPHRIGSFTTIPYYSQSRILDRLNRDSTNVLTAEADCHSTVSSTGPTTVRVVLGPLFALITR